MILLGAHVQRLNRRSSNIASFDGAIVLINGWHARPLIVNSVGYLSETTGRVERPLIHLREFDFHGVFGFVLVLPAES